VNRFIISTFAILVVAQPFAADAKPKDKGGRGVPPGQLRKLEVREALARGESPSRARKAPPLSVYRDWDRSRVYYWQDQPYRWEAGSWVIHID
jgi:hypothetical protein